MRHDNKPAGDAFVPGAPRRRLLTIGGCNTYETGRRLAFAYDHEHFWNVTWPSLGSDPFPEINLPPASYFDLWRSYVRRECEKTAAAKIAASAYDLILLSDGLQVLNDYAVLGDSVVPDITTARYLSDADLNGQKRPSMRDLVGPAIRIVKSTDPGFADFIVAAFARLHARILVPAMARGTKIVLHNHVFAPAMLTAEGIAPPPEPEFARMTALVAEIFARVSVFPGISTIIPSPALNFTSPAAPYGPSMAHPIEEQYVYLASRLADVAGDGLAGAVIENHLLEAHKARLAQDAAAAGHANAIQRDIDLTAVSKWLAMDAALAKGELEAMRRTVSWRVTAPLRAVRRLTGRWRRS